MNLKKMFLFVLLLCGQEAMPATVTVKMAADQKQAVGDIPRYLRWQGIVNPQCIIWYSGEDGLTMRARNFYRDNLFTPMAYAYEASPYNIWLYDLRAWKRLSKKTVLVEQTFCPEVVRQGVAQEAHVLSACQFFAALSDFYLPLEEETVFLQTLSKPFLFYGSVGSRPNNITCRDIGLPDWLGNFLRIDTARAYSALQYLESLWLVREIVRRQTTFAPELPVNVVFVLPSSGRMPEWQYYIGKDNAEVDFARDIAYLLETDPAVANSTVNVYFAGFDYEYCYMDGRSRTTNRPYTFIANDLAC